VAALLLLAGVMILSACGSKDKVKNDAKGRPDELYTDAMTKLRKGHYDEARLLLNVVINTYPDSEYLPLASWRRLTRSTGKEVRLSSNRLSAATRTSPSIFRPILWRAR
jgi:predicted Zn-dependent protease